MPASSELKIFRTFSDDRSEIFVVQKNTSVSLLTVKRLISSNDRLLNSQINICPCYIDNSGLALTPNGYIYVELKSENDYDKLLQVASQYGCQIIRQNEFMPCWYTLYLKLETTCNPIEVANKMHESGEFACAFPSFSYDPYF